MVKRVLLAVLGLLLMFQVTGYAGGVISGAGSTFAYPIYNAWAFYYSHKTGIRLNYQPIGSGGGIRQIRNKTVDFGATDDPITPAQQKKWRLLQFPTVTGGVVPVVNIPGIKAGQIKLTGKILAMIYLGKITKWNDPAIKSLNKNVKLPDKPITVVHRSDASGTTAIFTTYLSDVSTVWKKNVGAAKSVNWPVGVGGKGNLGVANYVSKIPYSIGYVEFSYAIQNHMNYVLMKNKEGFFVKPCFDTFKSASKYAHWQPKRGFDNWITNAPGKNSWPIAGATFILLRKNQPKINERVVKFFNWAFKNGDTIAKKLIYVPLPENVKNMIRKYWKDHGISY